MQLSKITLLLGLGILGALLQFIGALEGSVSALLAAAAVGVLGVVVARVFSIVRVPVWLLPTVFGVSALAGVSLAGLAARTAAIQYVAVLLAAFASFTASTVYRISSRRCKLCKNRLSADTLTFTCPRCALIVCDTACWDFEHRRCWLCTENQVTIFPTQGAWWDRTLGPAAQHGRCQACLSTVEQVRLQHCVHCRRLQCVHCWDHLNGECARCSWTLPNLHASLNSMTASLSSQLPTT